MNPPEQQGALVSGCGYCKLLYPEQANCSRCSGGTRVQPAQMLDTEGIRAAVAGAVRDYDGSRAKLDALLHVLFVYKSASLVAFEEHDSCDLEQLRSDDRRLGM